MKQSTLANKNIMMDRLDELFPKAGTSVLEGDKVKSVVLVSYIAYCILIQL